MNSEVVLTGDVPLVPAVLTRVLDLLVALLFRLLRLLEFLLQVPLRVLLGLLQVLPDVRDVPLLVEAVGIHAAHQLLVQLSLRLRVTKMAGPRGVKAHLSLRVQWRRLVLFFLISCVGSFRLVSIHGSLILPVLRFCCGHFSKLPTCLFTSVLAL